MIFLKFKLLEIDSALIVTLKAASLGISRSNLLIDELNRKYRVLLVQATELK